ncbi:MAG: hypothetical protein H7276_23575, partial [Caulobacter sp.]|nr:hypothetical protein [Vitreoscilla sp.]
MPLVPRGLLLDVPYCSTCCDGSVADTGWVGVFEAVVVVAGVVDLLEREA